MGLHWIGPGPWHDVLGVCDRLARAGHPVPYVAILNEWKACGEIKAVSPSTLIHFRLTGIDAIDNPSYEAGVERVRQLLPIFQAARADLFSIVNEKIPMGRDETQLAILRAYCQAFLGAMDEANRAGIKIAVLDLNTGHPDLSLVEVRKAFAPVLAQADRDGHYLCVNYYAKDGDPESDPDALLWQQIAANYPALSVVIREFNQLSGGTARGERLNLMMRKADARWRPFRSQLVGAGLYTLRGADSVGWKEFDFADQLALYEAYIQAS